MHFIHKRISSSVIYSYFTKTYKYLVLSRLEVACYERMRSEAGRSENVPINNRDRTICICKEQMQKCKMHSYLEWFFEGPNYSKISQRHCHIISQHSNTAKLCPSFKAMKRRSNYMYSMFSVARDVYHFRKISVQIIKIQQSSK